MANGKKTDDVDVSEKNNEDSDKDEEQEEKDEDTEEDKDESKDSDESDEGDESDSDSDADKDESKHEDYQGKLNATNRFLKKEGYEFKDGKWVKPQAASKKDAESKTADSMSTKDTLALARANVDDEDIEDVVEYAQFKKISISEALKSPILKATLSDKSEKRNTADATNTGRNRTGSKKASAENMLEKANKTGELPESSEDMQKLAEAHLTRNR